MIWYSPTDSDKFLAEVMAILRRNVSTVCTGSTMYQDLTSVLFINKDTQDLMVPVCHHHTRAIGILANHTT